MTSDGSDRPQSSESRGQISSVRFADAVLGNLGASLRDDESLEDEDEDEGQEGTPSPKDEEIRVGTLSGSKDVKDENGAVPSNISIAGIVEEK